MIKIRKKSKCCGCEACIQICPQSCMSLVRDSEGFLYPKVDKSSCVDCGLCQTVCPVINQSESREPLRFYAAKNPNEEIRKISSSGGVFTMLAEDTISKGGVVFGARFDENWDVIHDYTETNEGLAAFRGSKYVQSRIGDNFKNVRRFLEDGRQVLFSGTPCQVAALRLFLKRDYDNLLLIDIICHGVPSPAVWKSYLKEICRERGIEKIESISFRDKSFGWETFGLRIDGIKNDEKVSTYQLLTVDFYMRGFLHNIYLRPSCYACPTKGQKSGSDLKIADFWGIDNVLSHYNDNKGVSIVLINSLKGEKLFDSCNFDKIEVGYNELVFKKNQNLYVSARINRRRAMFFRKFAKNRELLPILKKYCKDYKPTFFDKIIWNLKHIRNRF